MSEILGAFLDFGTTLVSSRPEGWIAIVLIFVLFLVAVRNLRGVHQKLDSEQYALQECLRRLEDRDSHDLDLVAITDVMNALPADSVTKQAVRMVWNARRLANPDLNAILAVVTGRVDPRTTSLRATPNVLLLTGLLGTVVGLGSSVASLVPQIRLALGTTNPTTLTESLSFTLQEMQTAFAATLWGIIAALIAGFLVRRMQKRYLGIHAAIQSVIMDVVAPKLLPSSTEAQLDDIQRVLRESKDYMQNVTTIMSDAASQFEVVLSRTGDTMTTSITQLSTVSAEMQTALVDLSRQVQTSATSLDNGTRGIRESTQELERYHHEMRNAYADLGRLFESAREHTEQQTQEQIAKVEEVQTQFVEATRQTIDRLDRVAERLQQTTSSLDEAGGSYTRAANDTYLKLEAGFKGLHESFDRTLEAHRGEMNEVGKALETYGERIHDLTNRLDPALFPRQEWEGIREDLARAVKISASMHAALNSSPDLFTQQLSATKSIHEWLELQGASREGPEQARQVLELLTEIKAQLQAMSDRQGNTGRSSRTAS